jgi:hypothetical protein
VPPPCRVESTAMPLGGNDADVGTKQKRISQESKVKAQIES